MGTLYKVVKGRAWGKSIEISITEDGVKTMMSLNDFVSIVKKNIGPVTFVVKQETFSSMFDQAVAKAITDMDASLAPYAGMIKIGD
jgi:hypothetical protein